MVEMGDLVVLVEVGELNRGCTGIHRELQLLNLLGDGQVVCLQYFTTLF